MVVELPDFFADNYPCEIYYISGKDPKSFLQGQLICDLNQIDLQNSKITGYCTYQGRVISLGRLYQVKDGYLLSIPGNSGPELFTQLNKTALFSKIKITKLAHNSEIFSWIIYGRNLIQYLKNLKNFLNSEYIISSISEDFLEIISFTDPLKLSDLLLTQKYNLNNKIWNYPYIKSKIPVIYQKTSGKFLPHPLGLVELGAISFTKGCYLGQEIIARTHYLSNSKNKTASKLNILELFPDNINNLDNLYNSDNLVDLVDINNIPEIKPHKLALILI